MKPISSTLTNLPLTHKPLQLPEPVRSSAIDDPHILQINQLRALAMHKATQTQPQPSATPSPSEAQLQKFNKLNQHLALLSNTLPRR